jgi:hypothetical protein
VRLVGGAEDAHQVGMGVQAVMTVYAGEDALAGQAEGHDDDPEPTVIGEGEAIAVRAQRLDLDFNLAETIVRWIAIAPGCRLGLYGIGTEEVLQGKDDRRVRAARLGRLGGAAFEALRRSRGAVRELRALCRRLFGHDEGDQRASRDLRKVETSEQPANAALE